jgi:SPFH domain/Band 7 family protein
VQALEISRQQVITKDNVPVSVDGVLFFRVLDAALAVVRVQDYRFAVFQYARTSLRDVVGQMTLDELLSEREQIEATIGSHVEKDTRAWGLPSWIALPVTRTTRTMATKNSSRGRVPSQNTYSALRWPITFTREGTRRCPTSSTPEAFR